MTYRLFYPLFKTRDIIYHWYDHNHLNDYSFEGIVTWVREDAHTNIKASVHIHIERRKEEKKKRKCWLKTWLNHALSSSMIFYIAQSYRRWTWKSEKAFASSVCDRNSSLLTVCSYSVRRTRSFDFEWIYIWVDLQ